MNTLTGDQNPALMPLFGDDGVINGLGEGTEGSEDETDDDNATNERKDKNMFAAAMSDEYATLPHPIMIDSGVARAVLPRHWCHHAELQIVHMKGLSLVCVSLWLINTLLL